MDDADRAILVGNVESSIASLIEDKKINYLADTVEFVEGLLIGLEIARLYGDDIKKLSNNTDSTD